jgi:hypothetical protein
LYLVSNRYFDIYIRRLKSIIDFRFDRISCHGDYEFDAKTGYPLNVVGRTGITGRGRLGLKI